MLVEEMETATELFLVMELVKVRGWRDFPGAKSQDSAVALKDLIRKGFCYLETLFIIIHFSGVLFLISSRLMNLLS